MIEAALKCWREGFQPLLPTAGLSALAGALASDSPAILTGATVSPPPLSCCHDWPPESADPVAYALWRAHGLATVAEVEGAWARACFDCDARLGEPAGCRYWLTWWDTTDRDTARTVLLAEVLKELSRRAAEQSAA